MDILVKQRAGYRSQLTIVNKQVLKFWEARNSEQLDPLELQSVDAKIQSLLAKLTELDAQIFESITEDAAMNDEAEKAVMYTSTAWDMQSKISTLIRKFSSDHELSSVKSHESASLSKKPATKLPKLELAKFDGNPLNWQTFWDSFRHAIHENTQLSEVEKFQHLRNQLTDDAKKVADGYRLTEANYNSVVEVLIDRFGSEELAVFAHFDKLLAIPVANTDTQKLQSVYDETEKHIRSLVSLGLGEDTFGQVFTPIILSKLPRSIRTDLHRRNGSNRWTLSKLRELFREELKARQMGEWTLDQNIDRKNGKTNTGKTGPGTSPFSHKPWAKAPGMTGGALGNAAGKNSGKQKGDKVCIFCHGSHRHAECKQVTTADERKELVKGLCYKCLRKGHMSNGCPKPPKCFYCGQTSHHSSLCRDQFGSVSKGSGPQSGSGLTWGRTFSKSGPSALNPNSDLNPEAPSFDSDTKTSGDPISFSGLANSAEKSVFIQMQMAMVKLGNSKVQARLFFDGGCSRSYITTALAKRLGLKALGKEVISNGRFEESERRTHAYPRVELSMSTEKGNIPLSLLVTDTIACPITRVPIDPKRYPILRQLQLADPPPVRPENVSIDILIGNDQYFEIVEHERIQLPGGLILLGSKLGYITSGPVENVNFDNPVEPSHLAALLVGSSSVSYQNTDLERFWSLEDIGVRDDSYVKDDELALQRFNDSIRFDGVRFEVGWPWKSETPDLPSNYDLSFNRLKSLVRRLQKDSTLLEVYDRTILDQVRSGVVEQVPASEPETNLVHYLPHHCIVKPDRSTTKVRVVYDGSAKSARSLRSLNESLLRGPVFLQDLCGLLLRFRLNQYAVTADIEKAFLQVSLRASDRDVTRFLWLRDPKGPVSPENLVIYRFCRVLFGIISSPFLLDATIKHFLNHSHLPMAKLIAHGIYVDNLISGSDTEQKCEQIYNSCKQIFAENGMNIREWQSNSKQLMDHVATADKSKQCPLKVLGLVWNPGSDELSCGMKPVSATSVTTKRHLVSAASKVFDPCGFISPVVLQAKLLVQELWVRKIKWDQPLPADIFDRWIIVAGSVNSVPEIKIPRFLGYPDKPGWLIHCFCDASCKAYTGVVYLQISPESVPHLVFSKSKLAPIKPISMPRLELMGVLIGCRIASYVVKQMDIHPAAVTIWSDSKCVLQWVRSNKVLSVFVENRVREIQSCGFTLRYVPTLQNPADISSRGCALSELKDCDLWWTGPKFLSQPESEWPPCDLEKNQQTDLFENQDSSMAALNQSQQAAPPLLNLKRFSSVQKLFRVTAWVFRFCSTLLQKVKKDRNPGFSARLSTLEIDNARTYWIQAVQHDTLTPSGKVYPKLKNLWKQLGVFIDHEGLYRCKGRLEHASIPESSKSPLLLPRSHIFTDLLIKDIHTRNMHSGLSHTLSILRRTYWIPQGRSIVKSVIRNCRLCRRFEGGPFAVPPFPPLPAFRVERVQPFSSVGVDYFGPLYVKSDTDTSKAWVCLFTCASTRAIHLEVVTDMSTSQFLLALRRFISIYGTPTRIISDNAKHFKQADDFLQRLRAEVMNCDEVQEFSIDQGIQWVFIPEYSPWMGGFYERLVGTVKRSLKKALGRQSLSLVQLQTVISEVCSVVNTRPLVAPKDDLSPILTPADLLGKNNRFPVQQAKTYKFLDFDPPTDLDKSVRFGPVRTEQLLESWRSNRILVDQFWQIWSTDYLASLREQKSTHKSRNESALEPKVGAVVLIRSNLPRSVWNMGKIVLLQISSDGKIRSAQLRLPNGKTVVRPIKLLYPIESSVVDDFNNSEPANSNFNEPQTGTLSDRPTRRAALEARQKIQQQLASNIYAITVPTMCCLFSGNNIEMPVVNETVPINSPLSRLHSRQAFYVGVQFSTSVEMGAWYMILVVHGLQDLAHEMVNHPGLLNNANGIRPWLEQVEFRRVADVNIMLHLDAFYFEAARLALASPNSKILAEFRRYRQKHPDSRIQFLACAKNEYIFSCGVGVKFPTLSDPDTWPGFNVYGEVLSALYGYWAFEDENDIPTFTEIISNPGRYGSRYRKAALILSDSLSRHLRSIEYSDIYRRSGATFARLAYSVIPENLRAAKYIIILAGTNMTRSNWSPVDWESDWRRMLKALRPVLFEGSETNILINGPIWNNDRRAVKVPQFSDWLAAKVSTLDNITFFSWASPFDNPFVNTDDNGRMQPDPKYHDRDGYHVNKDGYLLFWRRWCYTFPELQLLSIKLTADIWQPLNRPHIPHSVNRSVQADDAGQVM